MAIIKAFLNTQYKSEGDLYQIVIRIHHQGRRKFYPTGKHSTEKDWDDVKGLVKKSHSTHSDVNSKIKELIGDAERYKRKCEVDNKPFNVNHVFEKVESDGSFTKYIHQFAEKYEKEKRHHAADNYKTAANTLKKYNKGREVYFTDINEKFVLEYDVYMKDVLGNKKQTRINKISELRKAYQDAADRGIAPSFNYFKGYQVVGDKDNKLKEWASDEEVALLEQIQWKKKGRIQQNEMQARDMYLFSCYCKGMRYSNVLFLKKNDIKNGKVFWVAIKGGDIMYQLIHPKLQEIIDRNMKNEGEYVFLPKKWKADTEKDRKRTAVNLNGNINKRLKKVTQMAGIKKELTFHCGRHTYGHKALQTTKSYAVVKDLFGHADVRSTQQYARGLGINFLESYDDEIYNYNSKPSDIEKVV